MLIYHLRPIRSFSKSIWFFNSLWRTYKWVVVHILDEEEDQFHQIIKREVKGMSHDDIKQLEKREFDSTIKVIGQDNLIINMLNRLDIEAGVPGQHQREEPKSLEHAIFRSIESLKLKKRRKGTWFTFENLNELKIILEKFPENHSLIRKALRISTASFKRLKAEWASLIIRDIQNKREERSKCGLNYLQKVYMKHFVKPPTIPLTLNEI